MIGVWSYLKQYEEEKKHIHAAIEKVFNSGRLILGRSVENFEKEFASYCKLKYGIGVNSGTDALFIAIKALGIGKGDEVITVPNTAIPTVSAICATGATPVFVDADPDTYLIDTRQIEKNITKKTKCILPVHLYGQCCDMDSIQKTAKKQNLHVIEDCAQSQGALWKDKISGSMSTISAFSFYPTKILGAYGDAGMVVTDSEEYAKKARMLRMYGMKDEEYYSHIQGYNTRLDEVQAEILRFKLTRIGHYIKKRQEIATRYYEGLEDTPLVLPKVNPGSSHAYYVFVCRHEKRGKIIDFMKKHGIMLNVSYKYPIHLMTAYKFLGCHEGDFPAAEAACRQVFSLPMYPELTVKGQDFVIQTLRKFFA